MRRRLKRHDEEAEINITPMLDIVFIMLIFFIVTTSFVKEFGVDLNRPSNEPPKDQKLSEVIAIRISDTGQISIKGRPTDIRAVRANIESGLAVDPDAAVVIAADRNADAGILVRVVDQARVAGASKVSLAALAD
ncbi:ExbD/TolR family protein [Lentisalinibacter salinarum]|uniref:ExbD/TolR family protein n=1 Tax=Lentisalinibacter salinarum TaxID=2992239 RepID=UPI002D5A49AC|nr:biopolymer transporter ExbD [Woeseiaceae bacterium]